MAATTRSRQDHQHARMQVLPKSQLGWWGFGLMLAAAAYPLYWAVLTPLIKDSDPEATIRTGITLAVVLPSLVVGGVALARRGSRSALLVALYALVAIEIVWTALVVIFWNA